MSAWALLLAPREDASSTCALLLEYVDIVRYIYSIQDLEVLLLLPQFWLVYKLNLNSAGVLNKPSTLYLARAKQ